MRAKERWGEKRNGDSRKRVKEEGPRARVRREDGPSADPPPRPALRSPTQRSARRRPSWTLWQTKIKLDPALSPDHWVPAGG